MICDKCGLEMRVTGSRNVVTGDKSPDEETRLYTVLTLECRNKQCSAYGQKKEVSNEQPIAKETTEEDQTTEESGE
jgi:hypothetical protein